KSLNQNISSNTNNTPRSFKLHQNYPNPFNPTTNIKFDIPNDANVSIKIYDLLGREVFSVSEYKQAGSYEMMFDGSNLASGLYFYSVKAETSQRDVYTETKKMVLIK
ncbi:MAG: T9SS type A sorting domain-containing protein, partial [Ignavibacteria bacterium]|nr:T9SS type A sorting domain-containing protein [Ignavibacteria bacterium]